MGCLAVDGRETCTCIVISSRSLCVYLSLYMAGFTVGVPTGRLSLPAVCTSVFSSSFYLSVLSTLYGAARRRGKAIANGAGSRDGFAMLVGGNSVRIRTGIERAPGSGGRCSAAQV